MWIFGVRNFLIGFKRIRLSLLLFVLPTRFLKRNKMNCVMN